MAELLLLLLDLTHTECSLLVQDTFLNPQGKYKCSSSFIILIQVLTAMKNTYQLCRFQNWLIFWCLLFLTFHLNELGKRGWLTKSCQRTLSSRTHMSPELQLELPTEGFCLWQTYLLTFAKAWSQRAGSHIVLSHHGQDCNSREKIGAAAAELFLLWGLHPPVSSATICRFLRYLYIKAPLSQWWPGLGVMRDRTCC